MPANNLKEIGFNPGFTKARKRKVRMHLAAKPILSVLISIKTSLLNFY